MNIYYGPTYDDILSQYDRNLEASIPFGWGIFGWINKAIFSPLYAWLTNYLSLRNCYYSDDYYGQNTIVICTVQAILVSG